MRASLFVWALVIIAFLSQVECIDFSSRRSSANPRSSPNNRPTDSDGDADDFYEILGVDKSSSAKDIKAAYRKKAVIMHPDKGGNAEEFKKLVEAYETISDDNKRKMYDRFGSAGVNMPGFRASGSGEDSEYDPFRDIFRAFGGFGFQMPTVYNLELSLEDIYAGREIQVNLGRAQVTVRITPGMLEGTELGADVGGREVIFVLQERPHPIFTRKKHDLLMLLKVPFIDALLGFERKISLLDGSEVIVSTPPNKVTAKDDTLVIEGLGMPIPDSPTNKRGDLYVHIQVDMPQSVQLSAEDRAVLQRIFGVSSSHTNKASSSTSSPSNSNDTVKRKYVMKTANIQQFGRRKGVPNSQTYYSSFRNL